MVAESAPAEGWLTEPVRTPIAFGPEDRRLVGFHHVAATAAAATGVVLCNPLGYEAMCTHRTYLHLAHRLSAAGIHALRYDHEGTGDSWGREDGPGRVRCWLDGVHAAVEELRRRAGVQAIALFGVRFGATLAALAAAEMADVDGLVLWAPSASGRAYVRELRAFRKIKGSKLEPDERADGGEAIAGYLFDRSTVAEMTEVDLLAGKSRVARRVLVVPRDDLPGPESRLAAHFETLGAEVRVASDPGYAAMMRDPQDSVVPFATLDAMVAWLRAGAAGKAESRAHRTGAASAPVTTTAGNVRETPFPFGAGERLFGIVAEPERAPAAPDRPAIVLLNVGANHHVGPNRMYVALARDLAELGYLSFRFDVAGLGDGLTAPGAPDNRLYSKDSVGDVKTAMDFLAQVRGSKRFVLVGLCSGAYLAFHTCIEDPRVSGQILLNPQTFEWKEGDSLELSVRRSFLSTRYYARALRDYRVWIRAVQGDVNVRGITGALSDRLRARVSARLRRLASRVLGRDEAQSDIERAFHTTSRRGVESLLVFSFEDGGLDMIEKHLGRGARRMHGASNFQIEIIDGADHTFTPIASQTVLYGLLERFVTARFP
ncbi:MAG TPA: alpha/beta fold hydrolase [Polyangiaceae bacterium]